MKIIADFPVPDTMQESGPSCRNFLRLVWPDSCWLLSDRPLYIPDFADSFVAIPMAAFKAGRLGKNISPRFAERYLTEFSVALAVLSCQAYEAIGKGVVIDSGEYIFDNAVVLGEWQSLPPDSLRISIAGPGAADRIIDLKMPAVSSVADMLASVSRHNTIKMGDVLLRPLGVEAIPLRENLRLDIRDSGSDRNLLTTRFK